MHKQYYKCLKWVDDKLSITYWYTSTPSMIRNCYDFIIPLGNRKPANISQEEIRQ